MIAEWLTEGTAHRSPVQQNPVIHLLVREAGDWRMWCTSGRGREDSPLGNRLCKTCHNLARDAVLDDTLNARDAGRWAA